MIKRVAYALAFAVAFWTAALAAQDIPTEANFSAPAGVLELKDLLKPYTPPAAAKPDISAWYTFTALNTADRPVIRVLQAGSPPGFGFSIIPADLSLPAPR